MLRTIDIFFQLWAQLEKKSQWYIQHTRLYYGLYALLSKFQFLSELLCKYFIAKIIELENFILIGEWIIKFHLFRNKFPTTKNIYRIITKKVDSGIE